jgi:hypothetical protein
VQAACTWQELLFICCCCIVLPITAVQACAYVAEQVGQEATFAASLRLAALLLLPPLGWCTCSYNRVR